MTRAKALEVAINCIDFVEAMARKGDRVSSAIIIRLITTGATTDAKRTLDRMLVKVEGKAEG